MKKNKMPIWVAVALFFVLTCTAVVPTWADVMIMPVRTVFNDRDRMKTISIINTSDKPAIFRLAFFNQKQVESGGYATAVDQAELKYDLSKMLVFSPRQVELPPRGKQVVRLSVRRPEGLPDGEYRTHLKLERIANEKPEAKKGAAAQLGINVGFAVPIMLRKGKHEASAKIADVKFVAGSLDGKEPSRIEFYLNRTGKHSTLGRGYVYWSPSGGGAERKVGALNNLNVFAEVPRRFAKINLEEKNISGGTFRLVFEGADADKGILFDEITFPGP